MPNTLCKLDEMDLEGEGEETTTSSRIAEEFQKPEKQWYKPQ